MLTLIGGGLVATFVAWWIPGMAFSVQGLDVAAIAVAAALGTIGGEIVRTCAGEDLGYGTHSLALWRAKRRRRRELHSRAAMFVELGESPKHALERAENEMRAEARAALVA